MLSGNDVDLAGVVKSTFITPASYDNEVTVSAIGDVNLHGDLDLSGSMLIKAGDDINIYNTALRIDGAGQSLKLEAGDAVSIGSVGAVAAGADASDEDRCGVVGRFPNDD